MAISLPLPRRQRRDPEAGLDYREHPELNAVKARVADLEQRMPESITTAQRTAAAHTAAVAELQQLEDLALVDRATPDQVAQARQSVENARRAAVRARVDHQDLAADFDNARAKHADLDASARAQAIAGLQTAHRAAVGKLVDALLDARAQGLEVRRLVELADSQFPEGHSGNFSGANEIAGLRDVAWSELDGRDDFANVTRLGSWLEDLAAAGLVETKMIAPVLSDEQRNRHHMGWETGPTSTSAPVQQPSGEPLFELVVDDIN